MRIILRIIRIALRHKWRLIGAYVSMAGAVAAYLLLPSLFGDAIDRIYDAFKEGGASELPSGELVGIAVAIILLSIVRGVLSFFQTYLGEALSQLVAFDIRNRFYNHVQHMSFGFHDRHHTGNLMSRAITDVENIRMFINMGLVRMPYFMLLFIIVGIILMWTDWRLGLLSTSFLPFVAYHSVVMRLKMRAIWLSVQEKMAELNTVLQENLTGVRVVKAFAAEKHEEERYSTRNASVAEDMVEAEKLRASNTSFMNFAFLISLALILWFGGWRVINGEMTPGELGEFVFYMQILSMPVRMTAWMVNAYARATSAGQRLFEILDTESPVQERPDSDEMPRVKGHVRFEDVSFSYDDDVPVLRGVNIDAKPGMVIALLGAPGSGKSTIVNLISRFYDVSGGRVTIDGIDVRDVTFESLRRNVGFVQQDVFLFTTSMKENIAYGRESASAAEVTQAAKVAQLHDFIESLDQSYETPIGERGSTLSGGQRQRMSIARAVLLDPPVLVLDDSTSSVDAGTEELIRRAMVSVMRGRTTFVIAHRLSTVHRADLILVLEEGQIVEQGTHQELLAASGQYRDIYELQLRPQEEVLKDMEAPVIATVEGDS